MGTSAGGRKAAIDRYGPPVQRFWSGVCRGGENECWPWTRVRSKNYGFTRWDGRRVLATHVVWFLTHGEWPRLFVLHRCDNPPCVNPAHLFLGTNADNLKDCVAKGRRRGPRNIGAANGRARLTPDQVLAIRASWASDRSRGRQSALARQYGVCPSTIRWIITGEHWTNA